MKKRVFVGVLGGLIVLTVAYAFAHGPGGRGPGMHGAIMKRMVAAHIDEAMAQAQVTPEQRAAITAARDRAVAAIDANRPDRTSMRDQVLALFEGERLDAAQLAALHAQGEQHRQQVHAAVAQAIVDIHQTLTPAQRKMVADYFRAHHHGPRS